MYAICVVADGEIQRARASVAKPPEVVELQGNAIIILSPQLAAERESDVAIARMH